MKKKFNKIKVAIVGIGAIANRHIEAISCHSSFIEIESICDLNNEALKRRCENLNVKGYANLEDLLSSSKADFIVLCTPNGLHAQQSILSAKAGFNVITEKPMSLSLKDAIEMNEVFKTLNKKLFVIKQVRLLKRISLIKEAIEKNHFGRIYLSNINLFWSRPQSFYDENNWRGTEKLDGGTLYNQAIHYIDLMVWLLGEVSRVHCFSSTLARDIEVEDTAVLNLDFKNGAKGSINATTLTYPKNLECSFTILGEKGTVKIGGSALDIIDTWDFENSFAKDKVFEDKDGFHHKNFYKGLIDDQNGLKKLNLTGDDSLETIKVIEAALQSSKNKKIIDLN